MNRDATAFFDKAWLPMFGVFLAVFLVSLFKINDFDIWFHVKAGEYYWDNGSLPHTDPFLFGLPEGVRDVSEWLSELLMFFVWTLGGSAALQLANSLILVVTFLILYKLVRLRGCDPWLAFSMTLVAVLVARFRWMPRPYQLVNLGVVLLLWTIERWKREGRSLPSPWVFALCFMLWTNLHPGAYFGLALLGLFWAESRFTPKRMPLSIPIAAGIGSLLNADLFGQLHKVLTSMSRGAVLETINEHMPPDAHYIIGWFGIFSLMVLATVPRMIYKKRWVDFLLVITILFFSFRSRRYADLLALLATPPVAQSLNEYIRLTRWNPALRARKRVAGLLIAVLVVGGFFSLAADESHTFGFGVDWEQLPVKAAQVAQDFGLAGNCYCIYPWGGYLTWCNYPDWKVFIDGRCLMYGAARMNQYFEIQRARGWEEAFDEYDVRFAIIDSYESGGGQGAMRGPNIVDALFDSPDWALVYWDGMSRVFVRRGRGHDAVIENNELDLVNPNRPLMHSDEATLSLMEEELERLLAANGDNVTALNLLGDIHMRRKDAVKAEAFYRRAVAVPNATAGAFANLGICLLAQRQFEEGVSYLEKAVESGLDDPNLCQRISDIHRSLGNNWKAAKWQRRADKISS